jgi:chondroitin AC lyase
MIYGKYTDPGAMNRDITRADANHGFGTATPERLLMAGDYRKNELESIIRIRKDEAKATLSHATFYWQSEYFTFQRPEFFTSVRMYSNRDYNMESPYNGEGLMNHHRGDGTNYLSLTGEEYRDIAPVYDWQKIPGATVVQKPELPSEKEIQKKGLTEFVGAVTDGQYGAVVFDFKSPHDPLEAKKSWFFFDREYVCLGSGINSDSRLPVATTINQCSLRNEVMVRSKDQTTTMNKGTHELSDVQWVLHNGTGYLFPKPVKLSLSNQAQTGSWYKINHQSDSPKEEVSRDIFKIWLDHGAKTENANYQYIVVPSTNEKEILSQPDRQISILSNSSQIQAVSHTGLNISELVFYQSGQVQISNHLKIAIDSPGLVIVKTDGAQLKAISVADPSRKLSRIHLTVTAKIDKKGAHFQSVWNSEKGISEITIDLPQTVYAGKSVTINI